MSKPGVILSLFLIFLHLIFVIFFYFFKISYTTFSVKFACVRLFLLPSKLRLVSLSSMFIFGGFSGLLLNDVLAYTLPSCPAFSTPTLCAAAGPGLRCHWLNGGCHPWEPRAPEHTTFRPAFCPARPGTQLKPVRLPSVLLPV